VAALKRAWVPGLGVVAGRKALKEIAETGQGGRKKALWAIGINAVVTLSLLAAIVSSWVAGGPSAGDDLMAYKAGQCFDVPGPGSEPQPAGDFVAPVRKRGCSGSHEGEVVSRWTPGRSYDAYPDEDVLKKRAIAECTRRLTAYAPDTWRWPASLQMHMRLPRSSGHERVGRSRGDWPARRSGW
jgi:hypothetical protein